MTTTELIAQGIGLVAMAINLISYQQKKRKAVIGFQFFGSLLFGINYFMLGAVVGGLLNCVGVIRAVVFLQKERLHGAHPAWLWGFSVCYVLSYVLSFTVFGMPLEIKNLTVEILPVIAMIVATYSYRLREAKDIRRFGLVCSPLWLVYRQYRTILMVQLQISSKFVRNFVKQTKLLCNFIDAGNSRSIGKEICAVWRNLCKQVCRHGFVRCCL